MTDPVNAEDDLVEQAITLELSRQSVSAGFDLNGINPRLLARAALEAVRSTRDGEIERYREALTDIASTDEAFVHAHGEAGAVAMVVDRASQALHQGTPTVR